jgi:tetratricopeptide (TPR) repeat protein
LKLFYSDPKKKTLQKIEIAVMVIFLPVGLYFGGKALQDYQRFNRSEALYEQGSALLHGGDSQGSIEKFEESVEIYPRYYAAWESLGTAHFLNKDIDKSVDTYERAVEALPESGNLHRELATAYHYAGLHDQEFASAEKAISLSNNDPTFTQRVYERAKQEAEEGVTTTEAIEPVNPAELLNPGHDHAAHDHPEPNAAPASPAPDTHTDHEGHDHEGHDH